MHSTRDRRARRWHTTIAVATATLCGSASALFSHDPSEPDRWKLQLTASAMAASYSGTTAGVFGRTVGGSIVYGGYDYADIYPGHQPLWLVDLAATRGGWGLGARGQLLDWSNEVSLANRTLIEETFWFLELDVIRTVGAHWNVVIGARYVEIEHSDEIFLSSTNPAFPATIFSWGHTWLDPIAGAAFHYPLTSRWEVAGRGDIGGFGIGSDWSWNVEASVQWWLGAHIALLGGYRIFDVNDTEDRTYGSDLTLSDTHDTRTEGPTLGFSFHW